MQSRSKHTTKSGPGRRHVEGTNRGSLHKKDHLPSGDPGDKLIRKALLGQITKRG